MPVQFEARLAGQHEEALLVRVQMQVDMTGRQHAETETGVHGSRLLAHEERARKALAVALVRRQREDLVAADEVVPGITS